jgi:hypothetical protein
MKFWPPRKLRPFERVLDAIVLALLLLAIAIVGYELGLGLSVLAGALAAVTQGAIQHRKSNRQGYERQP